ncbi:uncharacterized protein B0I36DRAFT_423095 [Microdochium trichocladiopsis]|uniref:Uncharacterized protein n=1 Tax=Microdochium trichocladiopsis TaxID=1682393 RepID=A0A9P9BPU0_9PEZI|nr:uncharacterized protein B0I36DRAFT_423095 [Microdochium trichocladiopsis]KAH7029470.1 hypothetical protein B0I36DRAFT_423095 [Microdochium trichocladiopsis]
MAPSSRDPSDKRPKRFRSEPTQSFIPIYERALSQRFFVLSRTRAGTPSCPEEVVEITGSTGNVYNVHIRQVPFCTCPHSMQGNQCKHILYVMARVLRARFELVYQLGLLKEELREIIENAPPIEVGGGSDSSDDSTAAAHDQNRKAIEGDCPICFSALVEDEASGSGKDDAEIVYCRAQCGQNLHRVCFEIWARTKRSSAGEQVTCPMCRTPWQGDDRIVSSIKESGVLTEEGYLNVADQLGINPHRDTSTYYSRFRLGYGRR